jgi:DNA polymerase-2
MGEARGFIISAWDEYRSGGDRILLTGRLDDGRSFAALLASPGAALFLRPPGELAALEALQRIGALGAEGSAKWSSMDGSPLVRVNILPGKLRQAERELSRVGLPVAGVDRMRADEVLAQADIRGPVLLRGEERKGRRVDAVFVEPELSSIPSASGIAKSITLRWLALDIETDREGQVVTVSLARAGAPGEVLFLQGEGKAPTAPGIEAFPDEASLLGALAARIVRMDPDVLTGWNVLDFDFKVILERCAALGVTFDAGRTETAASFVDRPGRKAVLDIPGRAVIDAMRLARGSGARYDDLTLETVAREVLGDGKLVSSRGEEKLEELETLRKRDPDRFCDYCLRDSELVLRILAATGLDALTARRAALTGVSLDLAWTSIPSFERVYGAALRARRVAVPPKEERRVSGAAGGTVLEARAGLFPAVFVLDFRSLYPSIMRTFNVDPLAYARACAHAAQPDPGQIAPDDLRSASMASRSEAITAPNGARFDREIGVMPGLIAEYAAEREKAIASGDDVAAFVYKILQNSFYGVLGAEGCRYARTEIAGAITSFGKKFLTMARDFFEAKGLSVLYGDTDSVFVLSGKSVEVSYEELMAMGKAGADELNERIAERVKDEYGLESMLRIRCEKAYARFLIPRLKYQAGVRDESGELSSRGRAKGYAGLLLAEDGSALVEVKGMEAARTDFTPLARHFQVRLLELVFSGAGEKELGDFCRSEKEALRRGERDGELVYRKTLRRLADDYASETPQVRAARLMGWKDKRGRVSYVMTRSGAEPEDRRSGSALDYEHYERHQLFPIAASIADALGLDASPWFGDSAQYELDF